MFAYKNAYVHSYGNGENKKVRKSVRMWYFKLLLSPKWNKAGFFKLFFYVMHGILQSSKGIKTT